MSMSRESTSLKKSSSDCLKLAKQWFSICVKWCNFWTTAFSQVVQKHLLGVVGNNSIYRLLTLSLTLAKYYENPTMLSRVTAKNVGDVFLRHTVYSHQCCVFQ